MSLMTELPCGVRGRPPGQPECLHPGRRAWGLALLSPGSPRSPLSVHAQSSLETEGWEPARTALPGELVPVMTAEVVGGCRAEGCFFLLFLQPG